MMIIQFCIDDGLMYVEFDLVGGVVLLKVLIEILMDVFVVCFIGVMVVENQGGVDMFVLINGKMSFNGQVFVNGKCVDDMYMYFDVQGGNIGLVN